MDVMEDVMPVSLLDNDLYKFTMQQAVLQHYRDAQVRYRFTNRSKTQRFSEVAVEAIRKAVNGMSALRLRDAEATWLEAKCPYFKESYRDYLKTFRLKPEEQVTIYRGADGDLHIEISGLWAEVIWWEVPILALVSENYFRHDDVSWDYTGQADLAAKKADVLLKSGIAFSEFGTRRRRSLLAQDIVVKALKDASDASLGEGTLTGTSNMYFAFKYNLTPVGTIAHEWFMGVAANDAEGYDGCNARALSKWEETYGLGVLSTALTDTFSTRVFFKEFDKGFATHWNGIRQDSGDPFDFAKVARDMYRERGLDPRKKSIIFSDGLSPEKCIDLKKHCDSLGIGCTFGIGTNFTNDFLRKDASRTEPLRQHQGEEHLSLSDAPIEQERLIGHEVHGEALPETVANRTVSKPLNIVIKLYSINDRMCVKISDELTKNTGDAETVKMVKKRFGLE